MTDKNLYNFFKESIVKTHNGKNVYFNLKRMFSKPAIFNFFVNELSEVADNDLVCSVDSTMAPLAGAIAYRSHKKLIHMRDVKKIDTRHQKKNYEAYIVGEFKKGEKVHLFDDVLWSGNSARKAIKLLRKCGLRPVHLSVILNWDRTNRNIDMMKKEGISVTQLFNIKDIDNEIYL